MILVIRVQIPVEPFWDELSGRFAIGRHRDRNPAPPKFLSRKQKAPEVRLELTTYRLTAYRLRHPKTYGHRVRESMRQAHLVLVELRQNTIQNTSEVFGVPHVRTKYVSRLMCPDKIP